MTQYAVTAGRTQAPRSTSESLHLRQFQSRHAFGASGTGQLNHPQPGQPVSAAQRVALVGEVDKGLRSMEFEVEQLRLLP